MSKNNKQILGWTYSRLQFSSINSLFSINWFNRSFLCVEELEKQGLRKLFTTDLWLFHLWDNIQIELDLVNTRGVQVIQTITHELFAWQYTILCSGTLSRKNKIPLDNTLIGLYFPVTTPATFWQSQGTEARSFPTDETSYTLENHSINCKMEN